MPGLACTNALPWAMLLAEGSHDVPLFVWPAAGSELAGKLARILVTLMGISQDMSSQQVRKAPLDAGWRSPSWVAMQVTSVGFRHEHQDYILVAAAMSSSSKFVLVLPEELEQPQAFVKQCAEAVDVTWGQLAQASQLWGLLQR